MARGGSRPGAGRKPGAQKVVNIDRKPRAETIPPAMETSALVSTVTPNEPGLAEPPADLSEPRKVFWRDWAPRAIDEGTLTTSTVLGFRELSEQYVIKAELARQCEAQAPGWGEVFKLWIKAAQRVDASMARFKLTALGKSAAPAKPKAAVNPWGAIAAPARK